MSGSLRGGGPFRDLISKIKTRSFLKKYTHLNIDLNGRMQLQPVETLKIVVSALCSNILDFVSH